MTSRQPMEPNSKPRRAEPLPDAVREAIERINGLHDQGMYTADGKSLIVLRTDIDTIRAHILGSAPSQAEGAPFDFHAHLCRQRAWSARTFGPGSRTAGVVDHIRKELREIEAAPDDLAEWIDVVILALDGAWRSGADAGQIIEALQAKQAKNEAREWPDWRTQPTDKAIEHAKPAPSPEGVTDASTKGDPDDEPFPDAVEFGIGITRTPRETYWIRRSRYWRERATAAETALSARTEPAPAPAPKIERKKPMPFYVEPDERDATIERLQSELADERAKVAVVERARDPSRLEIASMQMSGVWAEAADDGVNVTREDCAAEALLRADALIAAAQLAATPTRGDGG